MRRILMVATATILLAVAFTPSAIAKSPGKACTTTSENVSGETVTGTLTSSNVNSVQARFATCGHAKRVMEKATELRIEEPKSIAAFWCLPTVHSTYPDVVSYKCTFKGADTPMFVKLIFKVKYDMD